MHDMTEANLKDAFAGESQAHMKYLAFAARAEKDGFPEIGRLFRAISYAEQVHATNHLKALKGIGGTLENLEAALGGENFEIDEMYPAYLAVAELQEEKGAKRSMGWAHEAERDHARMYADAKEAVTAGGDAEIGAVHVCNVCGWTTTDEDWDECPICKAKREHFTTF